MALTKFTQGDDFMRSYNIKAKRPHTSGGWGGVALAIPSVGDLVKLDTSLADGVDRCVATDNVYGIVVSVNSNNGTVSIAEFTAGVTIVLEWQGTAPTIGVTVKAFGTATPRGSLIPGRDRVVGAAGTGTGYVLGVDTTSPAGAGPNPPGTSGTCVVRYP